MTYDKEFEEFVSATVVDNSLTIKDRLWFVWQAARKDHYRIGEEVEIRFSPDDEYEPATICASSRDKTGGYLSYTPSNVRRTPAKSRIDEIAEEVAIEEAKKNGWSPAVIQSAINTAKAAILKDREERETIR